MILLFSGGLDSTFLAERYVHELTCLLHFVYEHPAQTKELEATKNIYSILKKVNPRLELKVIKIPITAETMFIGVGEAGARVVPNRNAIMLSIASNHAHSIGATTILYGASCGDQEDYPDCRPQFFKAMSSILEVNIEAPLTTISKQEYNDMLKNHKNKDLMNESWSCYEPTSEGKACGTCNSCTQR